MAFDREYLTQMAYGGKGGNSLWHYLDVNEDNIASAVSATPNTEYFKRAFTDHGIKARKGDILLIASIESGNTATPVIGMVPSNWDDNGASVILMAGRFS